MIVAFEVAVSVTTPLGTLGGAVYVTEAVVAFDKVPHAGAQGVPAKDKTQFTPLFVMSAITVAVNGWVLVACTETPVGSGAVGLTTTVRGRTVTGTGPPVELPVTWLSDTLATLMIKLPGKEYT